MTREISWDSPSNNEQLESPTPNNDLNADDLIGSHDNSPLPPQRSHSQEAGVVGGVMDLDMIARDPLFEAPFAMSGPTSGVQGVSYDSAGGGSGGVSDFSQPEHINSVVGS